MSRCLFCSKDLPYPNRKYCSNKCQANFNYEEYIDKWKSGDAGGTRGINTKSFSQHVIRYIRLKYRDECVRCGWKELNPYTQTSPLEIDHKDGDSENNHEDNLILLCPNCHSLTPTYKNLNKGSGRVWRREKYVKIL